MAESTSTSPTSHLRLCIAVVALALCLLLQTTQAIESDSESSFTELAWTETCASSPYDYVAKLYFCANGFYGYKLHANDNCGGLAPLIRMKAGKSYKLILENQSNDYTNIHTHGLHIPGEGNTDNVHRGLPPGKQMVYNWTIPADHMDGTFWYHSHLHGQVTKQIKGGALGMMMIDPADNARDLGDRPDWISRERKLLILEANDRVLANGVTQETMELDANEWYRLRMVFSSAHVTTQSIRFDPSQCEVRAAAYDGVWRNEVPSPREEYEFAVMPASRIDFAINCRGESGIYYTGDSVLRDPPLVKLVVEGGTGGSGTGRFGGGRGGGRGGGIGNRLRGGFLGGGRWDSPETAESLEQAEEEAKAYSAEAASMRSWIPERPYYLRDLRNEPGVQDTFDITIASMNINDVRYDSEHDEPLAIFQYGSIQQWNLASGDPLTHPFHLHLYHYQVVTPGGCGRFYEEGEWYDTLGIPPRESCKIRFRMTDIGGRTVLHCHIQMHSEEGSIAHVDVLNAPGVSFDEVEPVDPFALEDDHDVCRA